MIGRVLSHYRVLRELGRGGMGDVYLGEDLELGRLVALKFVTPQLRRDPVAVARLRDEARAVAALRHPDIATIHDLVDADGELFLVMEYVEGRTLREHLRRGPLGPEETFRIGRRLADALDHAHTRGIVHRDVKPENVMVMPDGGVRLLDLGLARRLDSEAVVTHPEPATPYSTSPEQLLGETTDARTDVWGLGVVLYECLTGRRPFEGGSREEVARRILLDPPAPIPRAADPSLHGLDRIVEHCLRKEPEARFPSMGRLGAALAEHDPSRIRLRDRSATTTGLLMVVALMALLVVANATHRGTADLHRNPTARIDDPTLERARRITFTGRGDIPILSPDGTRIAYTERLVTEAVVYVVSSEGGPAQEIARGMGVVTWNWTPDGSAVIVHGRFEPGGPVGVWSIDLDTGDRELLVENAVFGDISPDGTTMAYGAADTTSEGRSSIWTLDLRSGERRVRLDPRGVGTAVYKPQWSPDASRLAFVRWNGSGHELWVASADDWSERRIETGAVNVGGHYDWTPDGEWIVISGQIDGLFCVWQIPVDGGVPAQLTPLTEYEYHASCSPDGQRFAISRGELDGTVVRVDVTDGTTKSRIDLDVSLAKPAYDPRGERLFFSALVNGRRQLWSVAGDAEPSPWTADPEFSFREPVTTADGRLLYVRTRFDPSSVFGRSDWPVELVATDGSTTGQADVVEGAGARIYRLAPSSYRSTALLYGADDPRGAEAVYVLDGDGPPRHVITDSAAGYVLSFDWGRTASEVVLFLNRVAERRLTLTRVDLATSEVRDLCDVTELFAYPKGRWHVPDGTAFAVSPDGERVAVGGWTTDDGDPRLVIVDLDTGEVLDVHPIDAPGRPSTLAWHPDGTEVAVGMSDRKIDVYLFERVPMGQARAR